jgi:trimethylamine:corrinoid methyltransferase-like protein
MSITARVDRINLRYHRAMRLVAATFDAIQDHLSDDARRPVHDALLKLFTEEGIEVLTDADRAALRLSPRGPDGWTDEEIVALDQRVIKAMIAQPPVMVAWPK